MDFHTRLFNYAQYKWWYSANRNMADAIEIDLYLNKRNWEEFQRWLGTPEGTFASVHIASTTDETVGYYIIHLLVPIVLYVHRRKDSDIPRVRPKAPAKRGRMVRAGKQSGNDTGIALDL